MLWGTWRRNKGTSGFSVGSVAGAPAPRSLRPWCQRPPTSAPLQLCVGVVVWCESLLPGCMWYLPETERQVISTDAHLGKDEWPRISAPVTAVLFWTSTREQHGLATSQAPRRGLAARYVGVKRPRFIKPRMYISIPKNQVKSM